LAKQIFSSSPPIHIVIHTQNAVIQKKRVFVHNLKKIDTCWLFSSTVSVIKKTEVFIWPGPQNHRMAFSLFCGIFSPFRIAETRAGCGFGDIVKMGCFFEISVPIAIQPCCVALFNVQFAAEQEG
jgi:hypothetical protein